jgi:hypothetical protein
VTSRTRKRQGEQRNPFLPNRNRHRHHLTLVPPEPATAGAGGNDHDTGSAGQFAQGIDREAPPADAAFSRLGGTVPYQIFTRGKTYEFDPVPDLDQPSLAAQAESGEQAQASASFNWSPRTLELYSWWREQLASLQQASVQWAAADDKLLGGVPGLRLVHHPDRPGVRGRRAATTETSQTRGRLRLARATVAEYFRALSGRPVGSLRVW